MKNKTLLRVWIAVLALMLMSMNVTFAFADDDGTEGTAGYTLGKNGKAAVKEFGISDNNIIAANSMDSLGDALDDAEDRASDSSSMFMVYMLPGNYKASYPITVPKNVLMVGEKETVFTYSGSMSYAVLLDGSIYGGTFIWKADLGPKKGRMLLFDDHSYSAPNGIAKNTIIKGSGWSGIEARGTSCKGSQVIGNTITDCKGNGVRSIGGSTIALVQGNKISGSGQAGIDITKANVTVIKDNYIHDVKGHGISTDTEQKFTSSSQPGYGCKSKCVIKDLINNKIINTGTHGIYLEDNCHITGTMSGNKIGKNGKCALGTHPKTTINKMVKNELYSSKLSVFAVYGTATMGSGNIIRNGKAAGICISKGGKLTIKGKNNKIYNNKKNGIQLVEKCSLNMSGKRNYIYGNVWGISLSKKTCKATVKGAKIYNNKTGAIYRCKGATLKKSDCILKGRVSK